MTGPVQGPAPTIETPRLRLRGHMLADVAPRLTMMADAAVAAQLGGPQSPADNWERVQRYVGHWALLGWGLFVVQTRGGGAFVGEAGLARFERGLGEDFDAAPEAAWVLTDAAAGQGLALEAMAAALAWHEGAFGPQRTVCVIAAANTRSLRLAGRLGYRPFRETQYRERPAILLERVPLPNAAKAR